MRHRLAGVHWSVRQGVAWITLTRTEHGNRIDQATAQALCTVTEAVEGDDRIAVVVVRGSGPAFCLGVERRGPWEWQHDCVAAIGKLTRPVVAAVNGDAVGEGFELALACDFRIVAATARFALPQLAAGYLPRHGATQRLPRLIGRMRAMELLLSGRSVRAREAAAMGLASHVVPLRRLDSVVRREVAVLQKKGPIALRLGKEAVTAALDLTLEQGMRLEQDLYVLLQTTADRSEGVRAFLGKRPPQFKGD